MTKNTQNPEKNFANDFKSNCECFLVPPIVLMYLFNEFYLYFSTLCPVNGFLDVQSISFEFMQYLNNNHNRVNKALLYD